MHKLIDMCRTVNIRIHGIMDSDYFGNTSEVCGIPVIASEEELGDPMASSYYKENFYFFCATNWLPMSDDVTTRNRNKRLHLLDLVHRHELECISLIHPQSVVSSSSCIGKGVYIDCFVMVEGAVTIEDHVSVYAYTGIGHHCVLKRNTVIQRHVCISGSVTFEENSYVGTAAKILKGGSTIGAGTFVHEGITIHRGTLPGEIVSMHSTNMRRVTFDS